MRGLVALLLLCTPLAAERVTFLMFNDVCEVSSCEGWGGLAGMQTLLERERDERSLTTVNGDFLSPSLLASQTEGKHIIELFNTMRVDYVCFGNHEFDFGNEILSERIKDSNFTWLGTNVLEEGKPFGDSVRTHVATVGNLKIALLGLCTADSVHLSSPGPSITFAPIIETAREAIASLPPVDLIVALTHQTVFEDMALSEKVPEIDIILGGHEHRVITYWHNDALILKAGFDARYLCRLDIEIDEHGITPTWQMIPNRFIEEDPLVRAQIAEFNVLAGNLDEVLTTLTEPLALSVAEAMRLELNADLSLINGGYFYGKNLPAGTLLTRGAVQEALAFPNRAMVIEIRGDQLQALLPKIRDPHLVGGPIDPKKTYRLATTDYLVRTSGLETCPILLPASSTNAIPALFMRHIASD